MDHVLVVYIEYYLIQLENKFIKRIIFLYL